MEPLPRAPNSMSSQLATRSSSYNTAFRALLEKTGSAEPSWLRRMRQDSFAHFERTGFPSVKEEEWKYTNVAAIAKLQFAPASPNGEQDTNGFGSFVYDEARQSRLVFVNGILHRKLSSVAALPDGVSVIDIGETLAGGQNETSLRERVRVYSGGSFSSGADSSPVHF